MWAPSPHEAGIRFAVGPAAAALTSAGTDARVSLNWGAIGGAAAGYYVFRANEWGGEVTQLQDVPVNITSFVDAHVVPERRYWYYVRGVAEDGTLVGTTQWTTVQVQWRQHRIWLQIDNRTA